MSYKMEMFLASCMFVLIVAVVLFMHRIPGEKISEEEVVETHPIELISGMPCEMPFEVIELNTRSAYEQETSKEEVQEGVWNDSGRIDKESDRHDLICQYRQDDDCVIRGSESDNAGYSGVGGRCSEVIKGEVNEQETSEEERAWDEIHLQESLADMEAEQYACSEAVENESELAVEESVLVLPSVTEEPIPTVTEVRAIPLDLHEYLMAVLTEHNIQHWYPYACAQIQQESGWNPYAENSNMLDKGLLQYRITFYPGANIFDPYEQIRIYVGQVANRLNAGLSIEETISRHLTSDYVTEIDWDYVNAVLNCLE